MKEQKWEQALESTMELAEVPAGLTEEPEQVVETAAPPRSQLTELRRRIEERLETRHIASEFEWDDVEDLPENCQ